jgi:hypothetical protein
MLRRVADSLGWLRQEVIFVGGTTLGLLLTDPAAPPTRPTKDVDLVAEIASQAAYQRAREDDNGVGVGPMSWEMTQRKQLGGDGEGGRQQVEQGMGVAELARFVAAPGLERLELLLNEPAGAIPVHDAQGVVDRLASLGGEEKPRHRLLPGGRIAFHSLDHGQRDRVRQVVRVAAPCRLLDGDRARAKRQ